MFHNIKNNWMSFYDSKRLFIKTIFTSILTLFALYIWAMWLPINETRGHGVQIYDIIHNMFGPYDLSLPIFITLHINMVLFFFYALSKPRHLFIALLSYSLMIIIRIIAMALIPLEAPETIIPLRDPISEISQNGNIILNDLFFSGHTSTLLLMYYNTYHQKLRHWFLFNSLLMGSMVILQHVHYSIDVIAAIFFSYGCYRLAYKINFEWYFSDKN